jgi:hypothetical protein
MNQREIHQSTLNIVKSINKSGTIVLYPSACKYHDDFQTLEFDNVILCSTHFEQSTIIGKVFCIKMNESELLGRLCKMEVKLNAVIRVVDCLKDDNLDDTEFLTKLMPLFDGEILYFSNHPILQKCSDIPLTLELIDSTYWINIFKKNEILGWRIKKLYSPIVSLQFPTIELVLHNDSLWCELNSFDKIFIDIRKLSDVDYLSGCELNKKKWGGGDSITEHQDYIQSLLKHSYMKKLESVACIPFSHCECEEIQKQLQNWIGDYPKKIHIFHFLKSDFNYFYHLPEVNIVSKAESSIMIKLSEIAKFYRGISLNHNQLERRLQKGDILISLLKRNKKLDIYFHEDFISNIPTFTDCAIVRPINEKYAQMLKLYFKTKDWNAIISPFFIRGLVSKLDISDLENTKIPNLSQVELHQLELEEDQDFILQSQEHLKKSEYTKAKICITKAFENSNTEDLSHKNVYLKNIDIHHELEEKNKALEKSQQELEDMMSMFAHKFRSPLDAIIYNTNHENNPKLYIEAAQTMRGLLDVFSIISTDEKVLKGKIKTDNQGNSGLLKVLSKTLNMILLHLLSSSGTDKIQQHYMAYAKAQGKINSSVTPKIWNEDYFELERTIQTEWEISFSELLSKSGSLPECLDWIEQHFFKLELIGFERNDIQFKEYSVTESFLTILFNEILVNAFKYYSSESNQSVVLELNERDGNQVIICRNPSVKRERTTIKGSGKGHVFLSALASKIGSIFFKPKPQDDFVVEFTIPNELLISN